MNGDNTIISTYDITRFELKPTEYDTALLMLVERYCVVYSSCSMESAEQRKMRGVRVVRRTKIIWSRVIYNLQRAVVAQDHVRKLWQYFNILSNNIV